MIDISELLKSSTGSNLKTEIKINPKKIDNELELEKPLRGTVEFTKLDNGVLAYFKIAAVLNLLCFRCAKHFFKKIKINFKQKYIFTDNKKKFIMDEEQEEGFLIDTDGKLDPWPAIRQEILLLQPVKILCKKNCRGLCPYCGQDLNEKKCKCIEIHKL